MALKHNASLFVDTGFLEANAMDRAGFTARKYQLDAFETKVAIAPKNLVASFTDPSLLSRLMRKTGIDRKKVYFEDKDPLGMVLPPALIKGYWQSEKFFKEHESQVRKDFKFKIEPAFSDTGLLKIMQSTESVSVHVRRGDFVTDTATNSYHGSLSVSYYLDAIEFLNRKLECPSFFFFSDDNEWLGSNFGHLPNSTIITKKEGQPDYMDMYYMSICRHNIIANSSFSWWGAWLNASPEKTVIAPSNWFRKAGKSPDLIPGSWIQLPG